MEQAGWYREINALVPARDGGVFLLGELRNYVVYALLTYQSNLVTRSLRNTQYAIRLSRRLPLNHQTDLDMDLIQQAARAIQDAERAVAFTGAGISVESGVPPFRGPERL